MNILGIWDGHDSGAALLVDGRLRFAVNEERLTRRKLEIAFPSRSIEMCLARAGLRPDQIDLVAATTSDPAKTLGRLWPGSKERYYAVRRRKSAPGPLAGLTRAVKYRMTEWAPGPISKSLSEGALKRELARHGLTRVALRLVDHHAAHAAGAAWCSVPATRAVRAPSNADGSDAHEIPGSDWHTGNLRGVDASPSWSPDGRFIAYSQGLAATCG